MGAKEDFMWTGTFYFVVLYVISTALLAPYVRSQTKNKSQGNDNFK